jgi:hypothetical protein
MKKAHLKNALIDVSRWLRVDAQFPCSFSSQSRKSATSVADMVWIRTFSTGIPFTSLQKPSRRMKASRLDEIVLLLRPRIPGR